MTPNNKYQLDGDLVSIAIMLLSHHIHRGRNNALTNMVTWSGTSLMEDVDNLGPPPSLRLVTVRKLDISIHLDQ